MRGTVWIAVALLGAACGNERSTEPDTGPRGPALVIPAAVDEPFTLAPGQTATLGGTDVAVSFLGVGEDSRCPTDVTCAWAGNADVELLLTFGEQQDTVVLSTPQEPHSIAIGAETLRLEALAPEPVSGGRIDPRTYRATLRLTARGGS